MGWSTLCKFAGDSELDGAVGILDGGAGVQRDITKLETSAAGSQCRELQCLASGAG